MAREGSSSKRRTNKVCPALCWPVARTSIEAGLPPLAFVGPVGVGGWVLVWLVCVGLDAAPHRF